METQNLWVMFHLFVWFGTSAKKKKKCFSENNNIQETLKLIWLLHSTHSVLYVSLLLYIYQINEMFYALIIVTKNI